MPLAPTHLFRALRNPNYRLFFFGQAISLVGTWITRLACSWLVYRLTGSEFLLGLVAFLGQIPALVISPIAGVYIDRWNRHRVLVITQAVSMCQSAALAGLTLTGYITVTDILILQAIAGCGERLRHSSAAVLCRANGRGPHGPAQRNRP